MHEQAIRDVERRAVDTDPIEARLIDKALKILGPNGEKWIKGREADKQHNHCMIGAIKLARRTLRRDHHIPHVPSFNDDPCRRFDQVREVMLLAKCEAIGR